MAGQSTTFKAFGTVLLWFGWLAFNAGSATATQASSSSARLGAVASRAAVSTMLAAASGGVTCVVASMLASSKVERALRLDYACNGILAGLVSITSSCAVVSSWAAFVIGIVGALVYLWFSRLLLVVWRVDDVVDACAVHFACGVWGVLAAGLFTKKDLWQMSYASDALSTPSCGVLYGCSDSGAQLAAQACYCLAIIAWCGLLGTVLFKSLAVAGILRVDEDTEEVGLDVNTHGGEAYQMGHMGGLGGLSDDDIDAVVSMVTGEVDDKASNTNGTTSIIVNPTIIASKGSNVVPV